MYCRLSVDVHSSNLHFSRVIFRFWICLKAFFILLYINHLYVTVVRVVNNFHTEFLFASGITLWWFKAIGVFVHIIPQKSHCWFLLCLYLAHALPTMEPTSFTEGPWVANLLPGATFLLLSPDVNIVIGLLITKHSVFHMSADCLQALPVHWKEMDEIPGWQCSSVPQCWSHATALPSDCLGTMGPGCWCSVPVKP